MWKELQAHVQLQEESTRGPSSKPTKLSILAALEGEAWGKLENQGLENQDWLLSHLSTQQISDRGC